MRRWLVLLLACSSTPHHGDGKPEPHRGGDAGVVEAPISQAECDELVTHAVQAVGSDRPDEYQAAARADMHRDCKGMTRAAYRCAMAAATRAALEACDGSGQL